MKLLSVHELLQKHATGTTSEATGSQLKGTLYTVTSDNKGHDRGTILLLDFRTNESIVCVMDRFVPLSRTTAYIHIWNFIRDETLGISHLEFLGDDIYESPTSDTPLLQQYYLKQDLPIIEDSLEYHIDFYKPGFSLQSLPKEVPTNIIGIVEAMSILYCKEGTPAFFFLELSNQQDVSVYVMFYGDEFIPFYSSIRIGSIYMFQNLLAVSIYNRRGVLSFLEYKSSCLELTDQQYELLEIKQPPAVEQTDNHVTLTMTPIKDDKSNTTYTGCITRVIDSMFGIYELDHSLILCLFHHMGSSFASPYRVMTRIRLHHIHVATVEPDDGQTTHLFNTIWKAHPLTNVDSLRYMVLVACMKSHVEILSFPPHSEYLETCVPFTPHGDLSVEAAIKEFIYMDCLERHANFTQLIRQLEIYAALVVKFVNSSLVLDLESFKFAYTMIRDQVFASTQSSIFKRAGDPVGDFIMHHKSCIAVDRESGVLHVVLDSYPFLGQVKALMEHELRDYQMDLAGSSSFFEENRVNFKMASYDQTENYCILGLVNVLPDGRLYLMDGNSRILMVVADCQWMDLGGIYLVRRAQMFTEDLSYVLEETQDTSKEMRQELSSTYLVCQDNDLIPLTDANKTYFQVHTSLLDGQKHEISKYQSSRVEQGQHLPQDHQYLVAHVITAYPIQVCFTDKGKLYMESRVLVKLYNMDGLGIAPSSSSNYIATDELRECILILSSLEKSLSWSHLLKAGTRWVIYGLDKEASKLKEAHRRRLTFLLHSDKHTLYPLLFKHAHNIDAIQLQVDFNSSTFADSSPLVCHVSQLSKPKHLSPSYNETTNNFFRKLVNVQGVIVTKRFIDGFDNVCPVSRHALQLYQDFGISSGKPARRLFVQLRQPDTFDVITIYIELTKVQYPMGLVIGSTVVFRNLIRKSKMSSTKEIFCVTEGFTTMEIINVKPTSAVVGMLPSTEIVPTRTIISFLDPVLGGALSEETELPLFKIYCSIQSVIALTLKWVCRDCGSIVRNNDCYSMCKNAPRAFIANAFVQISDGSGNANVSMDGERLIFKILQLSLKQMDALKNAVLKFGQITYGGWGTNRTAYAMDDTRRDERIQEVEKDERDAMQGYTLEDLCYNAKKAGQFWLYGRISNKSCKNRKRKSLHTEKEEHEQVYAADYDWIQACDLRKVSISDSGTILKTLEMNKLKIKAIEIEFTEARLVAYELLKKLMMQKEEPSRPSSFKLPTPPSVL